MSLTGASALASERSRPIFVDIAISAPARSIDAHATSTSRRRITSRTGRSKTSTSYIDCSSVSGSIPCDIVRLPCGSMSTHRTRWPSSAKAAARLSVVVVFATPPFWLAKAMTLAWPVTARLLGSVGEPSAHDSRARGVLLPARHNGGSADRLDPRRDSVVPRQPGGAVAAVLLRARRRDRARALRGRARRAQRLRCGARVDAADRRGDGAGARQRAADAGDHGADDGAAAGARRTRVARVPRLPRAAARALRGAARRFHLRDPRRAG